MVIPASLIALLTTLATGLGASPFVFVRDLVRSWMRVSNAAAAGIMLSASLGLAYEGGGRDLAGRDLAALHR